MWRASERVLFLRSRHEEGEHLPARRRRSLGTPRRRRSIPKGASSSGTGDARFDPTTRNLGNGIVAVKLDENKQLQLVDFFAPKNANWMQRRDLDVNVTPMAFDYKGTKFLIGTSKECRIWVLDRDALGGEDHRTPLYTSPLLCNDIQAFDAKGVWGSLSTWQDATGAQWVIVPFWGPVSRTFHAPIEHARPTMGGVAALKLEQVKGKWTLTPAWLSRDIDMAEEAIVANGIVFVVRRWRGLDADGAGHGVERAQSEPPRRRPRQQLGPPHSRLAPCRARGARWPDRQGAVVERHADHLVERLQRIDHCQRPRLRRHVRWLPGTASGCK